MAICPEGKIAEAAMRHAAPTRASDRLGVTSREIIEFLVFGAGLNPNTC